MPAPPVTLTFDLECGVRVCDNFSLPRPLCFALRPDVRDIHTDIREHHRLMPPPTGRGIMSAVCRRSAQNWLHHIISNAELDQLFLKCISITKYKLHFFKVIQILFCNYFGYDGQNTILESK